MDSSDKKHPTPYKNLFLEVLRKPSRFKYTALAYFLFLKNPIIEGVCSRLAKPFKLHQPQIHDDVLAQYKYDTHRCWIALQTGNIDESIKLSKSIVIEQNKDTVYHVTRVYLLAQCYALKGQEVEALELMHEALVLSKKMTMKYYARSIGGTLILYMMSLGHNVGKEMFSDLLPEDVPRGTQQRFEKAKVALVKNGFTLETCNWTTSTELLRFMLTRFTRVL